MRTILIASSLVLSLVAPAFAASHHKRVAHTGNFAQLATMPAPPFANDGSGYHGVGSQSGGPVAGFPDRN